MDASFIIDTCMGARGVVIRDDKSSFVACSTTVIDFVSDVATTKARELCDGLLLVGQVGCMKLIVNSDCMEVISSSLLWWTVRLFCSLHMILEYRLTLYEKI